MKQSLWSPAGNFKLLCIAVSFFVSQSFALAKDSQPKGHEKIDSLAKLAQLRTVDDRYAVRLLYERHPELQRNAKALSEFAINYAGSLRIDEAVAMANEAASISPEDDYVLASRAWVLQRNKNFSLALFSAKKAVKIRPNARNLAILSEILNALGDTTESEQSLEKARRLDPDSFDVVVATTRISISKLKKEEALSALNKYLKKHPKDLRALMFRSEIFTTLGRYRDCIADLSLVLKSKPNHAFALQKRAEEYKKNKEYPLAIADIRRLVLLDLNDSMTIIAYNTMADCQEKTGDLKGALDSRSKVAAIELGKRDLKKITAATLNGGFVKDILECCRLEVQLKQYESALRKLDAILLAYPNSTHARELRANAFEGLSRWSDALSDWDRLVGRQSSFPKWYENRARVYQKLGNSEAARRDLDTARKLSADP